MADEIAGCAAHRPDFASERIETRQQLHGLSWKTKILVFGNDDDDCLPLNELGLFGQLDSPLMYRSRKRFNLTIALFRLYRCG